MLWACSVVVWIQKRLYAIMFDSFSVCLVASAEETGAISSLSSCSARCPEGARMRESLSAQALPA